MRRPFISLLLMIILFTLSTSAAIAKDVKIGIIDTRMVLQKSTPAADARGAFLMEVESRKRLLKEKEKEIRVMEKVLRSFDKKKGAAEKTQIKEKMQQEIKSLRRLKADMEEELKQEEARVTKRLLSEIQELVNDYSRKNRFTVILEKKLVVASDEAVDITKDIIKLYNKKN